MRREGFTLIELLVTIAVAGVILTVISNFFNGTMRAANQELYTATQTAAIQRAVGLIGDDIRRAEQIVTSGTGATLTVSSPSGLTFPATTGNNRLDLYIAKPAGSSCALTDVYEFRSYFTVSRSALTGISDTWVSLPADAANNSRNVVVQYIGCTTGLSVSPSIGSIRLFADYVGTFQVSYVGAGTLTVTMQGLRTVGGRTLKTPVTPATGTYYSRRF